MPLLVPLAVAALAAPWLADAPAPPELLLGIALTALGAARCAARRPWLVVAALALAVAAAAAAAAGLAGPRLRPLPPGPDMPAVGRIDALRRLPDGLWLRLEPPAAAPPAWATPLPGPVHVVVNAGSDLRPGELLLVPGSATAAALGPAPGSRDRTPLVRLADSAGVRVAAAPPAAGGWILDARRRVARALDARTPAAAPVAAALVLGEDHGLAAGQRRMLRELGVSHLLAISGFNLALLAWLLARALLALGAAFPRLAARHDLRRPIAALVLAAVWAYAALVAGQPSVVRAALMATALLGAPLLQRRARALDALAAATLAALLATPELATEPGFQLSLAAVAGLLLAARHGLGAGGRHVHPADELFRRRRADGAALPPAWWNRGALFAGRWVGLALVGTTFAALVTAPIGVWHFGSVAPAAPLANLLAIPLFTLVVYPLAVLATLLALGPAPTFVVSAADAAARAAWETFVGLCEQLAHVLPGSLDVGRDGTLGVALVATALGLLLTRPRAPRRPALLLLLLLAVGRGDPAAVARGVPGPPPPGRSAIAVTFLDVGDADAILLRLADGRAALVDGGLSRGRAPLRGGTALPEQLRALGVRTLDFAVVTHPHPDHFAGLAAAAAGGLRVRELWLNPQGELEQPGSAFARFVRELERRGTRLRRTPELCGEHPWGPARLRVLAPCGSRGWNPGRDENDNSLILRLSVGCSDVLLTGDAGLAAEAELLAGRAPLEAEVLKVAHHGSRTASGDAFLARVRPRHAVVCAAPRRPAAPGPPHEAVLERLQSHGAAVWLTGRDGALTLHVARDGLRAWDAAGRPQWTAAARCPE